MPDHRFNVNPAREKMTKSDRNLEPYSVLSLGARRDPRLLRNLQYFEAVARHLSITATAAEIGVSLSAVSHQIRELSNRLGETLIERSGRGIKLTPVGERLAENLTETFAMLDASISSAVGGQNAKLTLLVCSAFGPYWLAPRLPRFLSANPNIEIELRLYAETPEMSSLGGDLIFTSGTVQQGYDPIPIFDESLIAVRKPGTFLDPFPMITTEVEAENLGADWYRFGHSIGLDVDAARSGGWIRSSHYILAMEMAKSGVGVALVPEFQAAESLRCGLLEPMNETRIPSMRSYNFCFKASRANEPAIRAFVRWLRREIKDHIRAEEGITVSSLN